MADFLSDAIALSNAAGQCINNCQFDRAVSLLIRSHKAIRCHINDTIDHPKQETFIPSALLSLDTVMLESQMKCSSERRSSNEDIDDFHATSVVRANDGYSIFASPIRLPDMFVLDCHETQMSVSLVAMFNLALAHHLKALSIPSNNIQVDASLPQPVGSSCKDSIKTRRHLLLKAGKLYTSVYELHCSLEQEIAESDHQMPWQSRNILLLALMNNCGQINHELGDRKNAESCFRHLFASLVWLRSTNWWESQNTTQGESLLGIFLETATSWIQENSLSGAAAGAA